MIPERLRTWWGDEGHTVLLGFDGERMEFERATAGRRERILSIESRLTTQAAQGDELLRQLQKIAGDGFRLILSLPPAITLRRKVALPLATEENLGQTLAFELDRLTPFKPDEAYFDFRICGRDNSRHMIEVDLGVARRSDVNELVRKAADMGLDINGLAFGSEVLGGNGSFGSEMASAGRPVKRIGTVWRVMLATLVLMLFVAFLFIPIWQKRSAAITLMAPLAEARLAAQQTDTLREQLGKLVKEYNTLPDKKWASPSLLQILDELTLRLKDDTYVSNLSFDDKMVTIQGESASAAELVEVLEASPLFHNVAFKSPLTKLQGGTHDLFHIGMEISPEGMPKPSEVASSP